MTLLPKSQVSTDLPVGPAFCLWALGFKLPAFTLSDSPCSTLLATSVSPQPASPTCYVYRSVSLPAKSVGLVGDLHLPTESSGFDSLPAFHGARVQVIHLHRLPSRRGQPLRYHLGSLVSPRVPSGRALRTCYGCAGVSPAR